MADILSRIRFNKDDPLTGEEIQQAKALMTAWAPTGIAQLILCTKVIELLDDNGLIPIKDKRQLFSDQHLGMAIKANITLLNKRFPDLQSLNVEGEKELSLEQIKRLLEDLTNSSTGLVALKELGLKKVDDVAE